VIAVINLASVLGVAVLAVFAVDGGIYTLVQADRGKAVYTEKCASCHGSMASSTPDMAPLLNDYVFQNKWSGRPLSEMYDRVRDTMPQNEPGTLSPQQTADLIAYILSANGLPAGDQALPSEAQALTAVRVALGSP